MRRSELAYIIQMARADQNQYGLDCTGSRLENLGACPQEVLGVQYQLWAPGTTKDQFLAQIAMAIIPVPGVDDLSGLADAGLAAAEDTGIAASRQAGIEGENLAGIDQAAKVRIPSATGTAAYRIPDALTDTTLTEVKNVANLSYTSQLQDYYQYAASTGRSFDLILRGNTALTWGVPRVCLACELRRWPGQR